MKIVTFIKEIFLYVFFPKSCFACGADAPFKDGGFLCAACAEDVKPLEMFCRRCGAPLKSGGAHCYDCRGIKADKFACSTIRSALAFNAPVRALVHNYKYNGHKYLAAYFVNFMAETFKKESKFKEVNLITAVPLHTLRRRKRGYNQAALLAETLAQKLNIEFNGAVLKRIKNTKSQTRLNKRERKENMLGAFECMGQVKNKTVLIVDDVCTTGATIEAAARELKACGAKKVYALVLARE